jgi:electron transfer flavoprotein alpha subunit
MAILVFVESTDGEIKNTSLVAISYAKALGEQMGDSEVTALVMGSFEDPALAGLGKYGATRVLHAADDRLNQPVIQAVSSALNQAVEHTGAKTVVAAKSSLADPVVAKVAVKMQAALISNVTDLPDLTDGFKVKRSVYTGKAFAVTSVNRENKIISIKKNAIELFEQGNDAPVEKLDVQLGDSDFDVTLTNTEKSAGGVPLGEAELIVSGGRGLKGPENWSVIEELAQALRATTGCSKPVSDMEWRPHHEHVGQTGVKVSPQLYIAVGISGAVQHVAGVNSSKYIVVINKDSEAPFFKAADYGIVGDAFEVLPKLTKAIKDSANN